MENSIFFLPLIIIGFLVFFASLWSFIAFITSRIWGWHEMSQSYRGEMSYYNKRLTWRSGRFGWGGYSGVLNFSISDEDLGISVLFLYRAGHPPLKIPLEEIKGVEKTIIFPEVHMTFDRVPNRVLKVRRAIADEIEKASGGNWAYKRKGEN